MDKMRILHGMAMRTQAAFPAFPLVKFSDSQIWQIKRFKDAQRYLG